MRISSQVCGNHKGISVDFHDEQALGAYLEMRKSHPELFPLDNGVIEIIQDVTEFEAAREAARQFRARHDMPFHDTRIGLLAQDPYVTLLRDPVRFPDGSLGLYNRIVEGRCVVGLPVLAGKLVLIRVFRHGLRRWSIEFPRGACEGNESPADAVRREIYEEIGAEVTQMSSLGSFTPGGGTLTTIAQFFLVEVSGIGTLDKAEGISNALLCSVAEVKEMACNDEIIDGFTLSIFLRALLMGKLPSC